jgi:hypothetical protein
MLGFGLLTMSGMFIAQALCGDTGGVKGAVVEEVRNERASFMVRVDVDHPKRIYQRGDTMTVTVRSEEPGYLYLFYFMADGNVSCLFPNKFQQHNCIPAKQDVTVPAVGADFRIRIGPPFGWEVLKAVVSLKPLKSLDIQELTRGQMTEVGTKGIRGAYVEQLKPEPATWAEHDVWILTIERGEDASTMGETTPRRSPTVRGAKRRVGVFVGVAEFSDKRIRRLEAPDDDAKMMRQVMCRVGQLDESFLLVNKQATLANLRYTICSQVAERTGPGDTVIIYMSTHGARCADTKKGKHGDEDSEEHGDEVDGFDEFLVLYNTNIDRVSTIRDTALMDDAFGRWLQILDGREIIVILDTCHSGGQATDKQADRAKDLPRFSKHVKGFTMPDVRDDGDFDFLDGEIARTKDIGQRDAALLAASESSQKAFERREGDFSVMTHYLIELLKSRPRVTLQDAFTYVSQKVPEYVKVKFPGTTQTPVLVPKEDPAVNLLLLRP